MLYIIYNPLTILWPDRRAIWTVGVGDMGEGQRRIGDCCQGEEGWGGAGGAVGGTRKSKQGLIQKSRDN